jgi:hypothetical protein
MQAGQLVMQGRPDEVIEAYRSAASAGVSAEVRHEAVAAH